MKRKQILARAITLGLLLAMPVGGAMAADLTIDSSNTGNLSAEWNPVNEGYYIYNTGSLANNTITIDGVEVRGNAWKTYQFDYTYENLPDEYQDLYTDYYYYKENGTANGANVYGAYAKQDNDGKVSDNNVTMNDGSTISDEVLGDFVDILYPDDGEIWQEAQTEFDTGSLIGGQSDGAGEVSGNTVTINGGKVAMSAIGGQSNGTGAVSGNEVILKVGTVTNIFNDKRGLDSLIGGQATGDNLIIGNKVTMNGGTVNGNIKGGYAATAYTNGEVTDNSVIITGGTVNGGDIKGGESQNGKASGNSVVIDGATIIGNGTNYIYGGESSTGAADNNIVSISNVEDLDVWGGHGVAGGVSRMGDAGASNNKVTLENVSFGSTTNPNRESFSVTGGVNRSGFANGNEIIATNVQLVGNLTGGIGQSVSNNEVTVKGDSSNISSVTGGSGYIGNIGKGQANAAHNVVKIEGGIIGDIEAGYVNTGVAQGNEVHVSGGTVNGYIYGGTSGSGSAMDNVIEISGGTINSVQIVGGKTSYGDADNYAGVTGNQITISGGTFTKNTEVIAGWDTYTATEVKNNTITVKKTDSDFDLSNVSLYGAKSDKNKSEIDNNALVIDGWRGTVKTIGGVTDLNFEHVDLSIKDGVLSAVTDTDLTGVKIAVNSLKEGSDLAAGTEYTIIDGKTSKITFDDEQELFVENIDASGNGVRVHDFNAATSNNDLVANITKSVLANVYVAEDGTATSNNLVIGEDFATNASVVAGAYASGENKAEGGSVIINGAYDGAVYAGYSESGKGAVGANTITLQDGADVGALYGSNTETAAGSLVVEAGSSKAASVANFSGATLAEDSELTTETVAVNTLTNDGKIIASGDVSTTDALTNKGTLKAEGDVSAKTLTSGDNSKLTANNVTTAGDISVGNGATITVNGVMSDEGALSVGMDSNVKASVVNVAKGVTLGEKTEAQITTLKAGSLNISDGGSVEAGSLQLNDGQGTITLGGAVTNDDGTISAARLNIDGDIVAASLSSGEGSAVTVGEYSKITVSGALVAGGSIDADEITAKTITGGASSSITAATVKAGETMSIDGAIDAASVAAKTLLTGADSSLTADTVNATIANIGGTAEIADAVTAETLVTGAGSKLTADAVGLTYAEINGEVIVNDALTVETLITSVNSELSANTLGVKDASIGGKAEVTGAVTAAGDVVVNEDAALTADSVAAAKLGVEGSLFTDVVKVKDVMSVSEGAEAEVTDRLEADTLINSGTLTGASADAAALTNIGTLNISGNVKTDVLTNSGIADVGTLTMSDNSTITANGGSLTADTITANNSNIIANGGSVQADTIVADNLKINALNDTEQQVVSTKLEGDNLIVKVNGLTENQVVIGNYTGESVSVIGSSSVTDNLGNDLTSIEAGMQDLADTLNIKSDGAVKELVAEEGSVLGKIMGTVDANGNLTVTGEDVNSFNQGVSEMASIALMTWRQENNDMNKRLGELRDSAGEHGVWVRMTRGESKYGNQNIKNQYNAYQLGYDEKLSVDKNWTVGAALTYTDANSSFSGGKGENKHKGIALYGSRLNDDGSFIDLIARYARLEHDFDVRGGAGKGDFDTNGYSLSAEYGKRFTGKSGLWLEPQVELTYGRVSSANYVTDRGVMVRQDDMDSLVGRLGFALGQNLAKGKGNVYLRASYLYDFEGETDARFMNATQQQRGFEQDLGGGWWEVGVGANINLSEATHLYFDVEKTYGGNVATPWQWNAGVRWSF